jgi:ADP-ribosyl-[dinitrogen reductase] hydrolase
VSVDPARLERATGALVGSVVGDALGAPFEFGPPGRFSERFPESVLLDGGEMVGGRAWRPAEWTDDTQMGLLVAQSLLERGGLDELDLFERFREWVHADPKDVGIQTSSVLTSGLPWHEAARSHFESGAPAAGNGSLMRATPAAIWFSTAGQAATIDAARRISALTHGDPAAGEGCAIFHEMIRVMLDGDDPFELVDDIIDTVAPVDPARWTTRLNPAYDPASDDLLNGAVWPALASALWALRTTNTFEGALRAAIDLGHDTDTVACITGGLAGARYGIGAIPSRWATPVNGQLIGQADSGIGLDELEQLARDLLVRSSSPVPAPPHEHAVEPTLVFADARVYAASLPGVVQALEGGHLDPDALAISLSRTFGQLDAHRSRRQVWLVDQDGPGRNLSIGSVLDDVVDTMTAAREEGRPVVVHCHGGRSRTGLVLRAWALANDPTLSVDASTELVRERWPHLDTWNRAFERALGEWILRRRADQNNRRPTR